MARNIELERKLHQIINYLRPLRDSSTEMAHYQTINTLLHTYDRLQRRQVVPVSIALLAKEQGQSRQSLTQFINTQVARATKPPLNELKQIADFLLDPENEIITTTDKLSPIYRAVAKPNAYLETLYEKYNVVTAQQKISWQMYIKELYTRRHARSRAYGNIKRIDGKYNDNYNVMRVNDCKAFVDELKKLQ